VASLMTTVWGAAIDSRRAAMCGVSPTIAIRSRVSPTPISPATTIPV
jgi:hypothetical protein